MPTAPPATSAWSQSGARAERCRAPCVPQLRCTARLLPAGVVALHFSTAHTLIYVLTTPPPIAAPLLQRLPERPHPARALPRQRGVRGTAAALPALALSARVELHTAGPPCSMLWSVIITNAMLTPPPRSRSRILNHWVSRFDLWPYLERFTIDATKARRGQLLQRLSA